MHTMCSRLWRTDYQHLRSIQALAFMAFLGVAASKTTAPVDATAMQAVAKSLTNAPSSWNSNVEACSWSGVTCDASGRVTGINLASAGVSGVLAPELGSLTALTSLQIENNVIGGEIPDLSKLSSLQTLVLNGNALKAMPLGFFKGLTALQRVSIDNVPFAAWSLSDDLSAASSLAEFSASNASLVGSIPAFFGEMVNLRVLRLSYNSLEGEIPKAFAGSGIQHLMLNNQKSQGKLTGSIRVIGEMPQLVMVWLQSNSFSGPIPDLSKLSSLESLNARDNAFTGPIPVSLTSLGTLKNVSLSNNELQGPYPQFDSSVIADVDKGNSFCRLSAGPCDDRVMLLLGVAEGFGYPLELATSWKGNSPCGANWIGVTCDSRGENVIVLNFANQHFGGVISPAIANVTSLMKIVLSGNNLTGSIPDNLTRLDKLELLDVSNNGLWGKVPDFAPSVTLKSNDNPLLGTEPSFNGGDSSRGTSGSSESSYNGSKNSHVALTVGIVMVLLVLIACFVLFLYYRHKKQGKNLGELQTCSPRGIRDVFKFEWMGMNASVRDTGIGNSLDIESSMGSENFAYVNVSEAQGLHMSIQSLSMATDNFSSGNIIGRGGFGVVYRGNLNGTSVAVKRNELAIMGNKGKDEFKAEIDVLRKVRHRNLVALLGYFEDGKERLLIYEYMSGGTLGEHLFEWQDRNLHPLIWKQRLTIALDVARGIEYLHSLAQESFIHRDLKPSNILLDQDLRAKVSDFGLVKLAEDKQKSMMTRLAGTFGYLAPEYATTGRASTKVDVYAFGVILMEIITGRKVLDESLPSEEGNLVPLFRRKYSHERHRFFEFVDSVLDLDVEAQDSLLEVADLAWHCTAREHYQRPDMSHAVNKLSPLVDQWKPSAYHDDDDGDLNLSLAQRLERWRHEGPNVPEFNSFK